MKNEDDDTLRYRIALERISDMSLLALKHFAIKERLEIDILEDMWNYE